MTDGALRNRAFEMKYQTGPYSPKHNESETRMTPSTYIKTSIASLAVYSTVAIGALCAGNLAHAANADPAQTDGRVEHVMTKTTASQGSFTKRTYGIKGEWQILKVDGQMVLRLSDDFRTKRGPDLKLFLSPTKLDNVTGVTATQDAVRLGALKSNTGASDYIIPAGTDLSRFNSVLIHCEAFSKLWGGADI